MRKKIVAGNWKMNTLVSQGKALAEELNAFMKTYDMPANKTVIIGTPFTHLSTCVAAVDTKKIHVAAQNCSQFEKGAYTGEVAANMIKDLGVEYTIIGHSERRQYFGDTDEVIATSAMQTVCLQYFAAAKSWKNVRLESISRLLSHSCVTL